MGNTAANRIAGSTIEMWLLFFLTVLASSVSSATHPSQTKPHPTGNLNSPLLLLAETESGADYSKREYTSYTWSIKNVGAKDVWLPMPKDRFQSKSTLPRHFLYRTKVSGRWTSPRLADHDVNYEADWVILLPGEKHQLFTTTFYKEDERFKEVEVSLTYRDDGGKIYKKRLSWLAASPP
jgi:hypothetical protein